ncbi:MAG: hypothetical protein LBS98_07995, partial [Coriobacteriales bacterium]|nr:hypothetical protein [Coriobacteriales bacterium]
DAQQLLHEGPEGVARMAVILLLRERCLPGDAAQDEHARAEASDGREADYHLVAVAASGRGMG